MILYVEKIIDVFDEAKQEWIHKSVYNVVVDGVDYGTIKPELIPVGSTILPTRVFRDFKNASKDSNGKYIANTIRETKYVGSAPIIKV